MSWRVASMGSMSSLTPDELLIEVCAALGMQDAAWIAQGGQKYVAKGTLSGAPAVAKVVPLPKGPHLELTIKRARREVEFLSAVESPHVVGILSDAVELGEGPDFICWVEQYLDGEDLTTALSSHPWDSQQLNRLLRDIGGALAACHEMEVVHRDLSPGNVRRTGDGAFVLMDPGLARHLLKTGLTGGAAPGTLGWRSPEHVPGISPIPASDIFALGLLAYYALTGKYAIDPSSPTYINDLQVAQAPPIKSVAPGLADNIAIVVDRCLLRQAARRYLDGAELLEDLDRQGL